MQQAEQSLQNLTAAFEQYLDYNRLILADLRRELEADIEREALLKNSIEKLQKDFLAFQDSFVELIKAANGQCGYSRMISARNKRDLTEWFFNQVKMMIFPEHWEECYKQRLSAIQSQNVRKSIRQ